MKFECETAATVSPATLKSVAKVRCHTRTPDTSLDRPYHTNAAAGVPGPGIDPKHLERVFDAFYTTKSSGVGMGLSICRSIIDAHGGRLWAEANEPRGAVFQFTLPGAERQLMPVGVPTCEPKERRFLRSVSSSHG